MLEGKKYDIIVFGATGFVGQLTTEYLIQRASQVGLSCAIAGRDEAKLKALETKLSKINSHQSTVVTLQADVNDYASLLQMARQARVLITTVGPYLKYGEPLVKACIEARTDYVDLTGEPEFVDGIRFKYQQQATDAGVRIVNCCGFDSIPHDLGVLFTLKQFKQKFPDVDLDEHNIKVEGLVDVFGSFSGGTWHSFLGSIAHMSEYAMLKKSWRNNSNMTLGFTPGIDAKTSKPRLSYRKELRSWAVPFSTIDPEVIVRSANLRGDYGRHFRYAHYILRKNFFKLFELVVGMSAIFVLSKFKTTRNLLLKLKKPGEGPDEQRRKESWFEVTFIAGAGGKTLVSKVCGGDPGYAETAKMLAEAALCLVFDRDKLTEHVGITTPAAAMGDVLLQRLQKAGIEFRVVE